jgi:hypothetical protein
MAEENINTTPSGLAGAMQGMQFVRGSMGQYEPVAATRPSIGARELPEEWGGRPTGESRRAIRMQAEWDKQRGQQLEEMRLAQQMEMEQRRLGLQERDQFIQEQEYSRKIKEYEASQDIKGQAEMESNNILDWLGGRAVDNQGNPIPKPDPKTPEFQTEFLGRLAENPLGAELNKGIVDQYLNANKTYLDALQTKDRESQEEMSWLVKQEEEASALGIDTKKFIEVDPKTKQQKVNQLGIAKEIGMARKKEAEDRQKQISQSKMDEELRSQAKGVLDDINKLDAEIRKENFSASRQKSATLRQANIDNVDFLTSERDVLINRFNSLVPQKTQETAKKFDSVKAAEAANLPKGTFVEINGRRARID